MDHESGSPSSAVVASAQSRSGDSPIHPRSASDTESDDEPMIGAEPTRCAEVRFSGRGQGHDSKTSQVGSRVPGGGDSKQVRCSESVQEDDVHAPSRDLIVSSCRRVPMAMSATQNPQPVSKRLRLTSRGSADDSPPATVVDALEFDRPTRYNPVSGRSCSMS